MRYFWLTLIYLTVTVSAKATAATGSMPAPQLLASQYMLALTNHNYSQLRHFYDRDTVFYDRTADKKYTGERHILDFFRRAHRGILKYKFNLEHMYNSGSLVVMIGNYHLKGPGEQFGKPGKIIEIAVPGVTTLKLDMTKGRIKEHIDLIDYQTMSDQLATQ